MKRVVCGLLLALGIARAPLCIAEAAPSPEQAAQADQLFREGTRAFEASQYPAAYKSLRAAWEIAPSYRTAAGLGQVELELSQFRDAALHLSFCLRHYPADGDPSVRSHVEDGLEQARAHVAALRVRVSVEGAQVTVDGESAGTSPLDGLVFVAPGSHVVAASLSGYQPAEERVETLVRATRDVALSLSAEAAPIQGPAAGAATPPAPVPTSAPPAPDEPSGIAGGLSPTAWVLIVGGSLTAAALATTIVFDVKGASAQSDLNAAQRGFSPTASCAAPAGPDIAACSNIHDLANTRNTDNQIAILGAIVTGALAAATAGTAWYVNSKERPAQAASARPYVRVSAGFAGGGLVVGSAF